MPTKLTVVGCGDAFASGGRHTSCYIIQDERHHFMLDCGATALVALKQSRIDFSPISTIFITHLHGDHFGGLPFVYLNAIYVEQRTEPLTFAGPPGLEDRFWQVLDALYPRLREKERSFKLQFVELPERTPTEVNGVRVTAFEVRHFSGAPSYALRFELAERTFAFTGDTGWTPTVIDAGYGVDLYLMECNQYDIRLDMHLDYLTVEANLPNIHAKRVVLTHLGDEMLARIPELDHGRYMFAEDGATIEF